MAIANSNEAAGETALEALPQPRVKRSGPMVATLLILGSVLMLTWAVLLCWFAYKVTDYLIS